MELPVNEESQQCYKQMEPLLRKDLKEHKLTDTILDSIKDYYIPVAFHLMEKKGEGTFVLGLNGGQGSGKTTMSHFLKVILEEYFEQNVVVMSIDDIYKTRAEREEMGKTIHPLFKTRGPSGTHEVELGIKTIENLKKATEKDTVAIPSFDKAFDDRKSEDGWAKVNGPVDFIIFEGWCVGAKPEDETALESPINILEEKEDTDGTWRKYANDQLREKYQNLFGLLDYLIMLKVPSMEKVFEWRKLQERKLIEKLEERGQIENLRTMSEAEVDRFVMHYERITRNALKEMPDRADILIEIGDDHGMKEMRLV